MMRKRLRAPLLVIACLVAAWAQPARAAEPFSAEFTGNANPVPATPCVWSNTETGLGTSTLGDFEWSSSEAADFCAAPGSIIVNGRFVLTFATGTLAGEYQTRGEFLFLQGRLHFRGDYVLEPEDSTGSLIGLSGSGVIDALADGPPDWGFVATLAGEISQGTE